MDGWQNYIYIYVKDHIQVCVVGLIDSNKNICGIINKSALNYFIKCNTTYI